MTGRSPEPAGGAALPDHLARLAAPRSALPGALRAAWHEPHRGLAILWARITGKRLRARQALAALAGIDHRLALSPAVLAAFPTATEPFADPDIVVTGAPGHTLVEGLTGSTIARAPQAGRGDSQSGRRDSGRVADAIRAAFADPALHALYGDALLQGERNGPVVPLLRPAFDATFLAGSDYIGPVVAFRRTALAETAGDAARPTDALFRIAERFGPKAIGHLPQILSIWRPWDRADAGEGTGHEAAVRAHLDRTGRADAAISPLGQGALRILHARPEPPPLASLIVPTRDRLDLLRPCIESLERTDWPALEVLVCDNDSREPETLAYLRALTETGRARVVPWPGPFDFAGMNNAAAAAARGRLLVFVNNDVTVLDPGWLDLMAREALRPEIGAVGAKLIDGAGRIQHGGIVLGTGGLVTHAHRHFPGDAPGYLGALGTTHAVSAVTAACLAVEARKFAAVGGFDAESFAVDFNDVDLCLRLNAAGFRSLLVPGAALLHDEAASRRRTPEARARHAREVAALKERWGPLLAQDPHYHPGFDPDLSTHARLRRGIPAGEARLRRPRY